MYFRNPPQKHRYFWGDQHLIRVLKILLQKRKTGGVEKVFLNLRRSFDLLRVDYDVNLPFDKINPGEPVVVLGNGAYALQGYQQKNPVIAGIGLMTHPSEFPNLCQAYPVVKYLQHSVWANNVYVPYFGADVCTTWAAGIDTVKWMPDEKNEKKIDLLIYNKIRWNKEKIDTELRLPLLDRLNAAGISYREIVYGNYFEDDYKSMLKECSAMIFLCEHESQGFALCEALSMNVPVLAWDQGYCLDPNRFKWNDPVIPASSVPFFDEQCGDKFKDIDGFHPAFDRFWRNVKNNQFKPRAYVLENLTLEKSGERMMDIVKSVYG